MKHLFKNFLNDKRVYHLNENYYQNLFTEVLNKKVQPFYNTTFGNGNKFYNANPMFSALHDNRIIRIIQKEPSHQPHFKAYLDTFDNLDELVIVLELTDQFGPVIRQLAQQWLVEKSSKQCIKALINSIRAPVVN